MSSSARWTWDFLHLGPRSPRRRGLQQSRLLPGTGRQSCRATTEDNSRKLVDEFIKGRSRPFGNAFERFVRERNLDINDQYWSEQEQDDYATQIAPLAAERETEQAELLAKLRAEYSGGEWTQD